MEGGALCTPKLNFSVTIKLSTTQSPPVTAYGEALEMPQLSPAVPVGIRIQLQSRFAIRTLI